MFIIYYVIIILLNDSVFLSKNVDWRVKMYKIDYEFIVEIIYEVRIKVRSELGIG